MTEQVASKWEWHADAAARYLEGTGTIVASVWRYNDDWLWCVGRTRYSSASSREQAQDDVDAVLRKYGWTLLG